MLIFVVTTILVIFVVVTMLVSIGVHQEERRGTLARKPSPTIPALLARRVLGTYIQLPPQNESDQGNPDQPLPDAGTRSGPGGNLLERAGQTVFRADDESARRHGWQVKAGRFGLSRVYRDPRFDLLPAERSGSSDPGQLATSGGG
jgi:hypothetical protein